MTSRDDMKRQNPSQDSFKSFANLIYDCITNKEQVPVHPYDMTIGDYEFLLYKLRILSYGSEYKLIAYCPRCDKYTEAIGDLEKLTFDTITMEKYQELRTVTLSGNKDTIKLKYCTPRMLDTIDRKVAELNEKCPDAGTKFNDLVTLKEVIDTVNGEKLTDVKLESYINNLTARDFRKLLLVNSKLNTALGVNTKMMATCTRCGGEVETTFRFGREFFEPTTI